MRSSTWAQTQTGKHWALAAHILTAGGMQQGMHSAPISAIATRHRKRPSPANSMASAYHQLCSHPPATTHSTISNRQPLAATSHYHFPLITYQTQCSPCNEATNDVVDRTISSINRCLGTIPKRCALSGANWCAMALWGIFCCHIPLLVLGKQ